MMETGNEFSGLSSLELMEGVDMHTGTTPIKYGMHTHSANGKQECGIIKV
jgi:hypothetical protein